MKNNLDEAHKAVKNTIDNIVKTDNFSEIEKLKILLAGSNAMKMKVEEIHYNKY